LTKSFVAGKLHNARNALLRGARETEDDTDRAAFESAAVRLGQHIVDLAGAATCDAVRGHEGHAARVYFDALPRSQRPPRGAECPVKRRSRRPPLAAGNAPLSFAYGLMRQDCIAALTAAGLDPDVGFLHVDRPGRPGLALDLMEEFRTLVADRL